MLIETRWLWIIFIGCFFAASPGQDASAASVDLAGTWYSSENGCPVDALFLNGIGGGHLRMQPDFAKRQNDVVWTMAGNDIHFVPETFAFHIDGTYSGNKIDSVVISDNHSSVKDTCTFERQ